MADRLLSPQIDEFGLTEEEHDKIKESMYEFEEALKQALILDEIVELTEEPDDYRGTSDDARWQIIMDKAEAYFGYKPDIYKLLGEIELALEKGLRIRSEYGFAFETELTEDYPAGVDDILLNIRSLKNSFGQEIETWEAMARLDVLRGDGAMSDERDLRGGLGRLLPEYREAVVGQFLIHGLIELPEPEEDEQ